MRGNKSSDGAVRTIQRLEAELAAAKTQLRTMCRLWLRLTPEQRNALLAEVSFWAPGDVKILGQALKDNCPTHF